MNRGSAITALPSELPWLELPADLSRWTTTMVEQLVERGRKILGKEAWEDKIETDDPAIMLVRLESMRIACFSPGGTRHHNLNKHIIKRHLINRPNVVLWPSHAGDRDDHDPHEQLCFVSLGRAVGCRRRGDGWVGEDPVALDKACDGFLGRHWRGGAG